MSGLDDTLTRKTLGPGSVVADRYRIIERLGQGGVGTVFRVEHTAMAKQMAMKVLRAEVSSIPEVQERFEREARSAARLDDPRIVQVTDFGRAEDGLFFLVMELVEGALLSDKLAKGVTREEAIEIVDDLLGAVDHAHSHDVIHRDLKPDNVMCLTIDGKLRVKVLDFGLAKITEGDAGRTLTQAGMVFGTPRYMSPEQASAETADHRSDLYSVGVILYEALAGKPPFEGDSAVDVLRAHITKPPPAVVKLHPKLQAVLDCALAKRADERFGSAAAFRDALATAQAEVLGTPRSERTTDSGIAPPKTDGAPTPVAALPVRAKSSSSDAPASNEVEPRRRRSPLLLVAVILMVLLGALTMVGGGGPEKVEAALDRGDLTAARAAVDELAKTHPDDPTTYMAVGQVALAENKPDDAHQAFARALKLDPEIASEVRFSTTMIALVKKNAAPSSEVVKDVAADGGRGSIPFLVEVFEETPSASIRRRAYAGLERLEGVDQIPNPVERLAADLRKLKDGECELRRWYVRRFADLDDPAILPALEHEADRSGVLPFVSVNGCMKDELRSQIARREKSG